MTRKSWKTLSKKTIWDKYVTLVDHKIRLPNGKVSHYLVQHGTGAVAILLSPVKGRVLLTYQYRYPLDKWIYDLPGGGITSGESPEAAIKRECEEETGYKPTNLIHLTKIYANPGRADWAMDLFFANKHKITKLRHRTPEEYVKIKILETIEVDKLIMEKKIIDPFLLIAWHTARTQKLI